MAAAMVALLAASAAAGATELPNKPILAFLYDHAELRPALVELGWGETELSETEAVLRSLAERLELLRIESDHQLRLGSFPEDGTERFNEAVSNFMRASREQLRAALGEPQWAELKAVALDQWSLEQQRSRARGSNVAGPYLAYTVFCTQYAAETAWEIAVPDAYVKFANRDWYYEPGYPDGYYGVRLTRGATIVEDVPVWDVGPWNIDDNYWNPAGGNPRPRRLYTDLPQGKPDAEAAFYDNYNGGLDQFGRTVLNPGGCDLSFDVATALGLAYLENDWIQVEYKWEDDLGGGEEFIYDNPAVTTLTGAWTTGTSSGDKYGSDYYWTSTGTSDTRLCVWNVEVAEAGTYDVSFWWPEGTNRTPEAELGLKEDALQLFSENQQINGGQWNSVGTFSFGAGTVRVGMRNGGPSGWVIVCDAVRLTKL